MTPKEKEAKDAIRLAKIEIEKWKMFLETAQKRLETLTHTHPTIEEHVQCKVCAQKACDATTRDMKAFDTQVGGDHYKDMKIQVTEFCQRNELNHCESSAIKYLCRHKKKGGLQDLKKAIHFIELLIELEYPHQI